MRANSMKTKPRRGAAPRGSGPRAAADGVRLRPEQLQLPPSLQPCSSFYFYFFEGLTAFRYCPVRTEDRHGGGEGAS